MEKLFTKNYMFKVLLAYALLLLVALFIAPWFGPTKLCPWTVFNEIIGRIPDSIQSTIFLQQRLPRVLLGLFVGASLGVTGAAFQALLRNQLATPYTLGIASAGTLAASISIITPALSFSWGPISSLQLFAFIGSVLATLVIYLLSQRVKSFSTSFIILAGVSINLFCGAALLFIRFLADPQHLVTIDRWTMGGLITTGYWETFTIAGFFLVGAAIIYYNSHAINQLLFGYQIAGSRGVDTKRLFLVVMAGGVILTTGAVSVAGPIGFVGLIIPHAVRMLSGSDQRIVLPASALLSAFTLIVCDTFARTLVAPTEIPVGVITACLGAPLFLLLLIKNSKKRES